MSFGPLEYLRHMTEKDLLERDAERDIGAELLQSVREMKAGKHGRVHRIAAPPVSDERHPYTCNAVSTETPS